MTRPLSGMYAALMTGLADDGSFSPERQRKLNDYVLRQGLTGLYVGGSSGESGLLDVEELLAQHLSLRRLRGEIRSDPAFALAGDGELVQRLIGSLPFKLTQAQQRAFAEISSDLRQDRPIVELRRHVVDGGAVFWLIVTQSPTGGIATAVFR